MEFLFEYGLFFAKTLTFVVAIIVVVAFVVSAGMRNQQIEKGHIEVKPVNEKYEAMLDEVKAVVLDEQVLKDEAKKRKKEEKEKQKALKKSLKAKKEVETKSSVDDSEDAPVSQDQEDEHKETRRSRIFILDFNGDIKASATEELRKTITAVLAIASKQDEIVVRLESPGGMVHGYGLASSQLARITSKNIPLTVCVDKVAASGGYMMACVANKIVAAPFSIIGSIGVVAQIPNFHRLLKKHDVDYEMLTAGEYKRTLTMFGENTDKGRKKFIEDLEDTHVLFKEFIREHRSTVDIDAVATGEIWFGKRALEHQLIDEISTSDEYLYDKIEKADLFEVHYTHKKSLAERLGLAAEASLERVLTSVWQKLNTRFFS